MRTKYYALIYSDKTFSYKSFFSEMDMQLYLGLDRFGKKVNKITIMDTIQVIMERINEPLISFEYGVLTQDKFIEIKDLLLTKFDQEITSLTDRTAKLSSEFESASSFK